MEPSGSNRLKRRLPGSVKRHLPDEELHLYISDNSNHRISFSSSDCDTV